MDHNLRHSLMLVTCLNPYIGYDNAAKVATIMADAAAHGMAIIRIRHRPPDGRATRTLTLDKGRLTEREMTDPAAQDANAVSAGADENEETQA